MFKNFKVFALSIFAVGVVAFMNGNTAQADSPSISLSNGVAAITGISNGGIIETEAGSYIDYQVKYLTKNASYDQDPVTGQVLFSYPSYGLNITSANASIKSFTCEATPYMLGPDNTGESFVLQSVAPINSSYPVCPNSSAPSTLEFTDVTFGAAADGSNWPVLGSGAIGADVVLLTYNVQVKVDTSAVAGSQVVAMPYIDLDSPIGGETVPNLFEMLPGLENTFMGVLGVGFAADSSTPVVAAAATTPTETAPTPDTSPTLAETGFNQTKTIVLSVFISAMSLTPLLRHRR